MPFTIAIVGRPNVGKSTLFNKLVGKKVAIVNDFSGVTRDRKIEKGYLGSIEFNVIDTAGLENNLSEKDFKKKMFQQTEIAIFDADLCLFLVNKQEGIQPDDIYFSKFLRERNIPTILVVNKSDSLKDNYFDSDYYKLGLGDPIPISAEHNNGFNLLYDKIEPYYKIYEEKHKNIDIQDKINIDIDNKNDDREITIAIVGRPNSGKSTLINTILNEERVITGDQAGLTRDAISIEWQYKDKKIKLIDTAGIRKKHNIETDLEKFAVEDAFRSIRFAQIVIMMIDTTTPFDVQDLTIANMIIEEGRGIVFALNKWDTISQENKHKFMNSTISLLENKANQVKGCPIIPISALYKKNIDKLLNACLNVYNDWNIYIKTTILNSWLRKIEKQNTPPLFRGKIIKLKYITQAKKRPPTFVLFTNNPEKLEKTSYDRFLINKLRNDFNLKNTLIRLILRKAENPYKNKKN